MYRPSKFYLIRKMYDHVNHTREKCWWIYCFSRHRMYTIYSFISSMFDFRNILPHSCWKNQDECTIVSTTLGFSRTEYQLEGMAIVRHDSHDSFLPSNLKVQLAFVWLYLPLTYVGHKLDLICIGCMPIQVFMVSFDFPSIGKVVLTRLSQTFFSICMG